MLYVLPPSSAVFLFSFQLEKRRDTFERSTCDRVKKTSQKDGVQTENLLVTGFIYRSLDGFRDAAVPSNTPALFTLH